MSTEEQYQRNPWTSSELGSKDPTTVITRRRNGKNRPRKNDQRRRYIASSFVLPLSHLSCRILGRWQLFLLVLGTLVSVFRDIVYTTARRMDRTAELTSIVFSQHEQAPSSGSSNNGNRKFATSPFVLQSSQLLSKLLSFEHLLEVTADAFIDYHRWHPYKHILCGEASNMTDSDRVEFSQQIAIFVTSFATKVRELRRVIGPHDNNGYTMADHREEMVSYLLERLSNFTKTSQRMQKEREKYSLNPLLLLSGDDDMMRSMSSSSSKTHATSNTSENNEFAAMLNKLDTKNVNNKNNTSSSTNPPAQVTQSFVDRYEAEIAPPTRLKAYKSIALKHKEILLKESKDLQVQYRYETILSEEYLTGSRPIKTTSLRSTFNSEDLNKSSNPNNNRNLWRPYSNLNNQDVKENFDPNAGTNPHPTLILSFNLVRILKRHTKWNIQWDTSLVF